MSRTGFRLSHAIEDYLKAIYELQSTHERVPTNALAERLNFAPASVTGMLKKLADYKPPLVDYARHKGVQLTSAGKQIALELVRHHRLIELYLVQALGYGWDEVHEEADRLEHVISEDFEDRIAAFLDDPSRDPHGHPIPAKDATSIVLDGIPLSTLNEGQCGHIVRVADEDPALLRYLAELGMTPNTQVCVTARAPFDGPLHVKVGQSESQALGLSVTDSVYVVLEDAE